MISGWFLADFWIIFGWYLTNIWQKRNELKSWDGKKIICKYSLLKKKFKTIINSWDCFCRMKITNKLTFICIVFKMVVGVSIIKEFLCKSGGGRLVKEGEMKPFKELEIKNSLFFLKILNYSLQLNKNYFFLFITVRSVIKHLMYLDSRTSSKLLPRSQTFSRTVTFRW